MSGPVQIKLTKIDLSQIKGADIKKVLTRVGYKYLSIVEQRNKKGTDVSGRKYKPYSREYADKKGRRQGWLQLTGKMLASRQVNVKGSKVNIVLSGTRPTAHITDKGTVKQSGESVSNALLAQANDKLRPFMGVSKKEELEIKRLVKIELLKAMKK